MGSTEFFATAAQVIPVLVLILVVEYRLFGGAGRGEWWASAREPGPGERVRTANALFAVCFLVLLFAAELLALDAVRTGGGSSFAEWVVGAALVLGLLMVLIVPTEPFVEVLLDRTPAYRLKVRHLRRSGVLGPDDPDPPRAGEGPPIDRSEGVDRPPAGDRGSPGARHGPG